MIKIRCFVVVVVFLSSCYLSCGDANDMKNYWVPETVGKVYEPHDPVSIVVNKVVPFSNPSETYRYYSFPFCQHHHHHDDKIEAAAAVNQKLKKDADLRDQQERKATQVKQEEEEDNDALIRSSAGSSRISAPLGQQLVGDHREISPYQVSFLDHVKWKLLCNRTLSPDDLRNFKTAIHDNYFFEMFVEDLPMWGYVGDIIEEDLIIGEMDSPKTLLFPHLNFILGYNENEHKIVSAKVTTDMNRRVDITNADQAMEVQFSYSVEWFPDELTWETRTMRYLDSRFVPSSLEVHWLSIINTFILVLIFAAFLTKIVVRDLKNKFSSTPTDNNGAVKEESGRGQEEEKEEEVSGWKAIQGDVFRFPQYTALLCACVGIGNQFLVITVCHLCLALSGIISSSQRGSLVTALVVLYCLTGIVAGYTSIRLYLQMNGTDWYQCLYITIGLFPTPTAIVFLWVNSLAAAKGSTIALSFEALCHVLFLFLFLAVPLTVVGGILAKKYASTNFHAPTRTTEQPREIPQNEHLPWYKRSKLFSLVVVAGFIPFSSIYSELVYVLASMWGHQMYTLFGILLINFVLLVTLTAFTAVVLSYRQLVLEDHRWWWTSFVSGGMTGVSMYLFCIYFFVHRSAMSGILQSSFYFGYMLIISFAFFIMLGSAGFQCSLAFVKYIYSRSRCD